MNFSEARKFGNITLIEGRNGGRYPFCNTLLIEGAARVLVDPGCGRRKIQPVQEQGKVDVIINTHFHLDHVSYNYLFPEAAIYAHRGDIRGFSSVDGYLEAGVQMPHEARVRWASIIKERFHFLGWIPTRFVEDGEELLFGETQIRVIHTPGHTPGHICLHFPDAELLYLGDLDLTPFGPWYGDNFSDIDDTILSVKKIKQIKAKWYVTSHEGPLYEDIQEPADVYIRIIEKREQRVLENIKHPATLDELSKRWIIYRKPRPNEILYLPGERAMIKKHLERLMRNGKATMEGDKYTAV